MASILAALLLCCLVSISYAGERAAALVNSFQVMCALEPLDFARSAAKAAAMKLLVRQDLSRPPDPSGNSIHSKSWLLPLKSGPHEFMIAEARGPKGEVKSCGIGASDVEGDDFKSEMVIAMKLGRAVNEGKSADGGRRTTVWRYGRDGLELMLTDGTPKAQSGIYLVLLKRPSAK